MPGMLWTNYEYYVWFMYIMYKLWINCEQKFRNVSKHFFKSNLVCERPFTIIWTKPDHAYCWIGFQPCVQLALSPSGNICFIHSPYKKKHTIILYYYCMFTIRVYLHFQERQSLPQGGDVFNSHANFKNCIKIIVSKFHTIYQIIPKSLRHQLR